MNMTRKPTDRQAVLSGNRFAGTGHISGVVHVIRDNQEIDKFREGEILVWRAADPAWTHLFDIAKGLITEESRLCPGVAEVAKERDLPVVLGVSNAAQELRSGDIISIHTDGLITRLHERREPDSPMRVSVPAAVAAREWSDQIVGNPKVVPFATRNRGDDPECDSDRLEAC